jgi:hypothetical protein
MVVVVACKPWMMNFIANKITTGTRLLRFLDGCFYIGYYSSQNRYCPFNGHTLVHTRGRSNKGARVVRCCRRSGGQSRFICVNKRSKNKDTPLLLRGPRLRFLYQTDRYFAPLCFAWRPVAGWPHTLKRAIKFNTAQKHTTTKAKKRCFGVLIDRFIL